MVTDDVTGSCLIQSDPGFVNWALVVIVYLIQNFCFTLAHPIKEDYLETCLLEDYH